MAQFMATREHIRKLIKDNSAEQFLDGLSFEQDLTFKYADRVFAEEEVKFGKTQKLRRRMEKKIVVQRDKQNPRKGRKRRKSRKADSQPIFFLSFRKPVQGRVRLVVPDRSRKHRFQDFLRMAQVGIEHFYHKQILYT